MLLAWPRRPWYLSAKGPTDGRGGMADQNANGMRLQVAGAKAQDVGKGTARLGRGAFEALGIREGDVIEIEGKRSTAAVALPPYAEDEGLEIIRLDGLQRANAAVSIGDTVE